LVRLPRAVGDGLFVVSAPFRIGSKPKDHLVKALAQLAPFVVIALLFWLLLIRPAQRRQRDQAVVQRAAATGSEIMLTSGIFGTVLGGDDDTIRVEVAEGTVIKVARAAVARVITHPDDEHEDAEDGADLPATPADEEQ
jgi:preprotein translocase subunit YajC